MNNDLASPTPLVVALAADQECVVVFCADYQECVVIYANWTDDVKILFDFWEKDGASMNEQLGRAAPAEVGFGLKRDGVPLRDAYSGGKGKL